MPPLGTPQDKVLRSFLTNRAIKNVNQNKVVALGAITIASCNNASEASIRNILNAFNDFVSSELFLDKYIADTEEMMRDEFEFWRKVKPKVNISKDGKLSMSVNSLRPST